MGVMTLPQLLGRLIEHIQRGAVEPPLHAAIDWSWGLLEPAEQAALAQTSVFRGGFSLGAAEAVVDLSEVALAPSPSDALQRLREKSLLRVWHAPALAGEP